MKIYIASHCIKEAQKVAKILIDSGHNVTSRWILGDFKPVDEYSVKQRITIAEQDYQDVINADALVLVSGKDKYSGGKFVEAGIALALRKRIIIIGRRENMLLWHPRVELVKTIRELKGVL